MSKFSTKLLVLDLDNTLYDWVSYFTQSFYAMVDKAVDIMSCDREQLLDDIREVHQRHHDSEHPFALLETKTVGAYFPNLTLRERKAKLDPAFYAFNKTRKQSLRLFPGVFETLRTLDEHGVAFAAYTESKSFPALDRIDRLGISGFVRHLYCRKSESIHPDPKSAIKYGKRTYSYEITTLRKEARKPDPIILKDLVADVGFKAAEAAYVGDSLTRDMTMAVHAGVISVWAKYGSNVESEQYHSLVRVSHWTQEEVEREKKLRVEALGISPDIILENSFSDLLEKLP